MEKRKFLKCILLSLGFAVGKGVKAKVLVPSDLLAPQASATPTSTPMSSATSTPSIAGSASTTPSYSGKPSSTPTATYKWDGSASPTPSTTPSYSGKPSSSPSTTPSYSGKPSSTPTATYKWDGSASPSASPTNRESATPSTTPTNTPSNTPQGSQIIFPSTSPVLNTPSSTPFINASATSTPFILPTSSRTPSNSLILNASRTNTLSRNNTSTNDFDSKIKISEAYPNPVNNEMMLDVDLNQNLYLKIEVINYEGKTISRDTVYVTSGKQTINIASNELSSGIYFCKISFNGNSTVKKFIKL